jgi:tetratricopeptide (TPR) repeat protein
MRFAIVSILVLVFGAVAAFGQGETPSNLVDSFGPIGCGDAQARADNFVSDLGNNPAAGGLINVSPDADDPVAAFVKLQEIMSQFRARRFDEGRISILISPPRSELSIQFWRETPRDMSRPPEPDASPAEYGRAPVKKAIKFGSSIPAEGPTCGEHSYDLNVFALAVSQIPSVKARVVVKARNATRANKVRAEMREELAKRVGPANITFANVISRAEGVELWLVPDPVSKTARSEGETGIVIEKDSYPQIISAMQDIEKYDRDLSKDPDDVDLLILRARSLAKVSRTSDALKDLTKAISLSKHDYYIAQATTDRGEVYLARKEYGKAAVDFTSVIGLGSAAAYRPRAFLNRAKAHYSEGKNEEALKDVNEAIALYSAPGRAGAKRRLGEAFALRFSINCAERKTKAAAADAAKARTLGTPVMPCRSK